MKKYIKPDVVLVETDNSIMASTSLNVDTEKKVYTDEVLSKQNAGGYDDDAMSHSSVWDD